MSVNLDVPIIILVIVTCNRVVCALQNLCLTTCLPKLSEEISEGCDLVSNISASGCNDWLINNASHGTLGDITLNSFSNFSGLETPQVTKIYVTITNVNFTYLKLEYRDLKNIEAMCHSFNLSRRSVEKISHHCFWPDAAVGSPMELRYQAYNSQTPAIDHGHYIFRVPNPNRIDPEITLLEDWEFFIYIDVSDKSHITVWWPTLPSHFNVQYYLLKLIYARSEIGTRVVETLRLRANNDKKKENYVLQTEALSGKYFVTLQIFHKNCSKGLCFVSKSPIFSLDKKFKSPMIIAAIGLIITLPGFLYVFHSWRRFGSPPHHKAPLVLLIYKRTLDSHFKVLAALVMYLRKYCHIRALLEDFDILSADTQDSSLWYREAFSRVDAVMVVSSPHHMDNDNEKAYYNVNATALHILEEKSKDPACSLKLFSVVFPYCTEKDIPKEAENLPKFRFPRDLNSVLWFIRFGNRTSCFSKFEYYLFQSQINGGACDYTRYGKFLTDALMEANEESRKLLALVTEAQ